MFHSRPIGRSFALGFSVMLVLAAALPLGVLAKDGAAQAAAASLGPDDERLLSEAIAAGRSEVTVLVAAKGGASRQAAQAITNAGGRIAFRDDALGYLRASVPLGAVRGLAANAAIQGLDLDDVVAIPDPAPDAAQPLVPQPVPDANTDRDNPYMPIGDTGAAAFLEAHPEWDGRGVTIGIVDTGVSLDHPSLLTTSTGARKVVEWVTGTDPVTDNDPTWINMATQVSGASFSFDTRTYTAPAAGSYRIGVFRESNPAFGGEFSVAAAAGGDLNRDGDETDNMAVLWNTASNQVWVDTDADNSFADETAMTDYRVNYDIGRFGVDRSATAVRDEVPFVVQTDGKNKFVNIGIVSGLHGSHVTGIATGNALFGGEMSGAAPGAQVVSSRACLFVAGCTNHALLEGMIYVAKQANVDVINMSIGGLPALNDGNNARCAVYQRLIDQENVQMFFSIGNSGPGVNTAGDPGLCATVMGMGAYLTDETMLADYGTTVNFTDNLHYFSSRGPREDGGFSPSAVAPGAALSTIPLWQPQGCLAQTCPLGYALANGTSMAAPQTTGLGALLVSASKANGTQAQPAQIRQALMSTARYLTEGDRFEAYDQGVGLLDVNAAWAQLRQNLKPVTIAGRVPVSSPLNAFLATPGIGSGIYDREGVELGEAYSRTYTFTRSDGPGGSVTYNVSWVDDDGIFSSAGTVTLPRGTATPFTVNINPSSVGSHSAILRLDDPATVGIDYQSMNTVIVPYEFAAEDGYAVTIASTVDIAQTLHYFFEVPAGTPAFKVDLSAPDVGQIRFLRWHPWGLGVDSNAVSNCYINPATACSTGSGTSRTVQDPIAGVWEVSVDARRTSAADDAPFTLTASVLGASVSPDPDVIPTATIGVPVARSYEITNLFGAFIGRAVGTSMGSAHIDRPTIADNEIKNIPVVIPAGATSLRATIGNPSDPGADLDLFVLNPAGAIAGQAADGDSEESVTLANPAAGTWTIRVDGFSVPAGSTAYDYIDVFYTTAAMGTITVTDANALRAAGDSWTVPATVTAAAAPAAGRVLYGNVEVRTDANVLIGRGDVIVQQVLAP
jgi:subtilisin family serine protease